MLLLVETNVLADMLGDDSKWAPSALLTRAAGRYGACLPGVKLIAP